MSNLFSQPENYISHLFLFIFIATAPVQGTVIFHLKQLPLYWSPYSSSSPAIVHHPTAQVILKSDRTMLLVQTLCGFPCSWHKIQIPHQKPTRPYMIWLLLPLLLSPTSLVCQILPFLTSFLFLKHAMLLLILFTPSPSLSSKHKNTQLCLLTNQINLVRNRPLTYPSTCVFRSVKMKYFHLCY